MRNNQAPTDEELLNYLRAGWHMHQKKVKKYLYVVRRKGQDTRSIGPYTDELWSRIQNLEHQLTVEQEGLYAERSKPVDDAATERRREASRRFVRGRENIIKSMTIWRGTVMSRDCKFKKNDFCTYWLWEEKMPFFSSIQDTKKPGAEYFREHKDETGAKIYIIQAGAFYCANCHAYEPSEKRDSYPVLSTIASSQITLSGGSSPGVKQQERV
jgi:hypothetical protein